MFSTASKRLQGYLDSYKVENIDSMKIGKEKDTEADTEAAESREPCVLLEKEKWSWEQWQKHFIHMEEQEKAVASLKVFCAYHDYFHRDAKE
jgi:hypothetical protein